MPINMRLSPSDDRFFSPDRDIAYCAPHLVHRAVFGLNPDRLEPWIRDYMAEQKIEPEALGAGAVAVAEYMNKTLKDPQYKEPYEALEAAGFFALHPSVQHIVLAKLGQIFLSSIFPSIRDITRDATQPAKNSEAIAEAAASILTTLAAKAAEKEQAELLARTPAWCGVFSKVFGGAPVDWAKRFGVLKPVPEKKV